MTSTRWPTVLFAGFLAATAAACGGNRSGAASGPSVDGGVAGEVETSRGSISEPGVPESTDDEPATENSGSLTPVNEPAVTEPAPDAPDPDPDPVRAEAPPLSVICGDGIRDPETEECDDGAGFERDVCSAFCRVRSMPLERVGAPKVLYSTARTQAPALAVERKLGAGRHPLGSVRAASPEVAMTLAGRVNFAVSYIEPNLGVPKLGITWFDAGGQLLAEQALAGEVSGLAGSVGSASVSPLLFSDPVLVGLSEQRYALAWTDYNGDGDELGIGLAQWVPTDATATAYRVNQVAFANQQVVFSQHSPDLLWTGSELIAVWVDDSQATAPDLRWRRFDAELNPLGDEEALAETAASEGNVALSSWGDSWVAAWRASTAGSETIVVRALPNGGVNSGANMLEWSVVLDAPAGAGDRPKVIALDADHLLLAYSEGTDARGDGLYAVPRMRAAVLRRAAQGTVTGVAVAPLEVDYAAAELSQNQPNALQIEDRFYLTWRTSRANDNYGAEVWLKEIFFDTSLVSGTAGSGLDLTRTEWALPRANADEPSSEEELDPRRGDQRLPALAAVASPRLPGGAIAAAWDDFGRTLSGRDGDAAPRPGVSYTLIPSPVLRLPPAPPPCSEVTGGCLAGAGHCANNGECAAGLTCGISVGPRFGFSRDVNICVPLTCSDGVQNAAETAVDCGGGCGECAVCPPPSEAGDDHFCSALCPCGLEEGDCDTDEQCERGLRCGVDNGAEFGLASDREVCVEGGCGDVTAQPGEPGFCVPGCPCADGQGHCVLDEDCQEGSSCHEGLGPLFGFDSDVNVCLPVTCENGVLDAANGETAVDCGGPGCAPCDSLCALTRTRDGLSLYDELYCSETCLCAQREGGCDPVTEDEPSQCQPGLTCIAGIGFGAILGNAAVDEGYLCLPDQCSNGGKDNGEPGFFDEDAADCGGEACAPCDALCALRRTDDPGDWCDDQCGCENGMGPCVNGGECLEGQHCVAGLGPLYSDAYDDSTSVCIPAACNDGIRNNDEEAVDCGDRGTVEGDNYCPPCEPLCERRRAGLSPGDPSYCTETCLCAPGEAGCTSDAECFGGAPVSGEPTAECVLSHGVQVCQSLQCLDRVQNGAEEAVDCGGPDCVSCEEVCAASPGEFSLATECTAGCSPNLNACDGCDNGTSRLALRVQKDRHFRVTYRNPESISATNITAEFWYRVNSGNTRDPYLIDIGPFGFWQWNWQTLAPGFRQRHMACSVGNGTAIGGWVISNPTIQGRSVNDGKWHHIACSYDGTEGRLYIDGELEASEVIPGPVGPVPQSVFPHGINAIPSNAGAFDIDDVRLRNEAYTDATIANFREPYGADANTVLMWHMEGNGVDASGNGNDLWTPGGAIADDHFVADGCHTFPLPATPPSSPAEAYPPAACVETGEAVTTACDGCEQGSTRQVFDFLANRWYSVSYSEPAKIAVNSSTLEFWLKLDEPLPGSQDPVALGPMRVMLQPWDKPERGAPAGTPQCIAAGVVTGPGNSVVGSLMDQQWHHIACVLKDMGDGSYELRSYLDGVSDHAVTSTTAPELFPEVLPEEVVVPGGLALRHGINVSLANTSRFVVGAIDELRLSNVARPGPFGPLGPRRFENDAETALLWHFDGSGADASGNGNHLRFPVAPEMPAAYKPDTCYGGRVTAECQPGCALLSCGDDPDDGCGGVCTGLCLPAHCKDNVQNADETGVDCGGADCNNCPPLSIAACDDSDGNICDGCESGGNGGNGEVRQYFDVGEDEVYRFNYPDADSISLGPSTLEFWWRADSAPWHGPNDQVLALGPFGINNSNYNYNWLPSPQTRSGTVVCGVAGVVSLSGDQYVSSVSDGKWHHIACVLDDSEARLYLDGKLQARADTGGIQATLATTTYGYYGPNANGGGYSRDSAFDEVRLSKVARYNQEFTPPRRFENDEATEILWHFDGDGLDHSGNGNHLFTAASSWASKLTSDDCYGGRFDPLAPMQCASTLPAVTCSESESCSCQSGEKRQHLKMDWRRHFTYGDIDTIGLENSTLEYWYRLDSWGSTDDQIAAGNKVLSSIGPFYTSVRRTATADTAAYAPYCVIKTESGGSAVAYAGTDAPGVDDGQWHHIACVLKKTTTYVNGSAVDSYTLQAFVDGVSSGPVAAERARLAYDIGTRYLPGFHPHTNQSYTAHSSFDEVRLLNVARTPDFQPRRFADACAPDTGSPALLWHFDGNMADSSPNGHHFIFPGREVTAWLEDEDCRGGLFSAQASYRLDAPRPASALSSPLIKSEHLDHHSPMSPLPLRQNSGSRSPADEGYR